MIREVPDWETELWSYIGSGNGRNCPMVDVCTVHDEPGHCPDDLKERINELLEATRFNPSDFNFIKGPPHGRMHELVEKLACHYLIKGQVSKPPVSVNLMSRIDDNCNVEIRQVPLKTHHGAIWKTKDMWVIHINSRDSKKKKRFTLFHEAFHILAHLGANPVFSKQGTDTGYFNEMMANCFSTFILMPESLVRSKWVKVKDLNKMADIFQVPKPVVYVRLKWMGLL